MKRNFCKSIWTVCTTCTVSLLPGIMEVKTTSGWSIGNIPKQHKIIIKWEQNAYVKRPTWHNTLKSAKSSSVFGQRHLLTLINDSLSLNFMDIFLLSSWIFVKRRKKHWPRCVKIILSENKCTQKYAERLVFDLLTQSSTCGSLFWSTIGICSKKSLHWNCTGNNGLFMSHNDLDLHTGDLMLYVCLLVVA